VTWEAECLDRLYLNGYIGTLATPGGLVTFIREQLGKPIPSPVVLGQVTERFHSAVKSMAEGEQIPIRQFTHEERKTMSPIRFEPSVARGMGWSLLV